MKAIPKAIIINFLIIFAVSFPLHAATYYVSPGGNDNNTGLSVSQAWQHVQKACTTLTAGDTVFIRSGTYSESSPYTANIGGVSVNRGLYPANNGTPGNEIVFKGYPGDSRPIIIGVGKEAGGGYRSPALLDGKSYIVFDSLEFRRGYRGIFMGAGRNFTMKYCVVDSTLGPLNNNNGGFISFANQYLSLRHVSIDHCEFFDNGDESGYHAFNTSGIHIYACDSCEFSNNNIHDQTAGIHIKGPLPEGNMDSTKNIKIYGNTVYDCGSGIWVLHQGIERDIDVYNNVLYGNGAGIILHSGGNNTYGGSNVKIYNNTIDCGGSSNGITGRWSNFDACSTFNNIIYRPGWDPNDYKGGHAFKNEGGTPTNYYEDYNIYYGRADGMYFVWPVGVGYNLSGWRNATNDGDHDQVTNPMFVNAAAHDYRLQDGSPALTAGRGGSYPSYLGAVAPDGEPPPPPPDDNDPPIISGVDADPVMTTTATISWITSEAATSRVQYGPTTSYGSYSPLSSNLVFSHVIELSSLDSNRLYHYRVISEDSAGNEAVSSDYTFTTLEISMEQLAEGMPVTVSSSYPGYSADPITDGTVDPYGGTSSTWASNESSSEAHWVEIDLGSPKTVQSICMCWAWNEFRSCWMTSQEYHIQVWDGSSFQDVQTVSGPTENNMTMTTLNTPVTTSRIRVWQPANMGSDDYPTVMWITELEAFGSSAPSSDTTAPAAVTDLSAE